MSCWAMRGAECMYLSAGEGLVPLLDDGEVDALAEHIDVFGGDLTCCARGHPDHVCDREALVKPMLGLFVEIYERHRNPRDGVPEPPRAGAWGPSPDSIIRTATPDLEEQRARGLDAVRTPHTPRARPPKDAYAVVEPLLERLYPRTFDWRHTGADGEFVVETVPLFGDLIDAARYYVDRGLLDKRRGIDDDDAGVPDFEPGSDGRRHDVPDEARERSRLLRQRSTLQSFRHLLPPRSLSSHSTQGEAFRRMPSRSGGSSMRSVGTNSTAYGSPRRSSSTASARSARLFLGPRSLGSE